MAKFVRVKAFTRGVLADSDATVINVEQITHFYERTLKMPNGEQPVVHCDINSKGSMMLDCSMVEFVQMIESASVRYSHQTTAQVGEITYKCQS